MSANMNECSQQNGSTEKGPDQHNPVEDCYTREIPGTGVSGTSVVP